MLIKKKNSFKIIKNKLFESIKNIVLYLFCFQVIIFLVVFFWYQLSPIKKIHTPEKIINCKLSYTAQYLKQELQKKNK